MACARDSDLAQPCYVSSLTAAQELANNILPVPLRQGFSEFVSEVQNSFKEASATQVTEQLAEVDFSSQRDLDALRWEPLLQHLFDTAANDEERATLLAAQEVLARHWLDVLPVPQLGLCIDDATFRINVCLRYNISPTRDHMCTRCKHLVDGSGTHGLRCKRCVGRFARHSAINEEIRRAPSSSFIPAQREPAGLLSNQVKPDGVTLVPWRGETRNLGCHRRRHACALVRP